MRQNVNRRIGLDDITGYNEGTQSTHLPIYRSHIDDCFWSVANAFTDHALVNCNYWPAKMPLINVSISQLGV